MLKDVKSLFILSILYDLRWVRKPVSFEYSIDYSNKIIRINKRFLYKNSVYACILILQIVFDILSKTITITNSNRFLLLSDFYQDNPKFTLEYMLLFCVNEYENEITEFEFTNIKQDSKKSITE